MNQEFLESSLERCPHDEKNPYSMINNALIRDSSISMECRWLIIYCLANTEGWKIQPKFILKSQKIGRDKLYRVFNEGISAGYISRTSYINDKGFKRFKYLISEKPKFKNGLLCPDFPDTENQCTENQCTEKPKFKNGLLCPDFPDTEKPDIYNNIRRINNKNKSPPTSSNLENQPIPPIPQGGVKKITPHFFITKTDLTYLKLKTESPDPTQEKDLPLPGEIRNISPEEPKKKAPPKYSKESSELVHFISETAKKNDPKCGIVSTPDEVFRDRKFAEDCINNTGEPTEKALELCKKLALDSWKDDFWKGRICSAQNLKKHWNSLRAGLRTSQNIKPKGIVRPAGHFQEGYENPLLKIDMSKGGIF